MFIPTCNTTISIIYSFKRYISSSFGVPLLGAFNELKKNLQIAIKSVTPQLFLKRLMLFDLISVKESEMLQQSMTKTQGKEIISQFVVNKLHKESSIYYERFKYLLGYYEDLRFMYLKWKSLCKT